MRDLFTAAAVVQAFCQRQNWTYCFIGGLALQAWGEPRETIDVDLTILTGFGGEEDYIEKMLAEFEPRRPDAAAFAVLHRILLLYSKNKVGIDVSLGGHTFEVAACERATDFRFPGAIDLRVCSAEDLVVMKSFAARPRDWLDVEGVIIKQTGKLDWDYILRQLRPLAELKDEPQIVDQLLKRREEFEK